jgi:hypothetical protein
MAQLLPIALLGILLCATAHADITRGEVINDSLFLNVPLSIVDATNLLPPTLKPDTYQGNAIVTLVCGNITMQLDGRMPVPVLSREVQVGIYVTGPNNGRGIYLVKVIYDNDLFAIMFSSFMNKTARVSVSPRPMTETLNATTGSFDAVISSSGGVLVTNFNIEGALTLPDIFANRTVLYTATKDAVYASTLHQTFQKGFRSVKMNDLFSDILPNLGITTAVAITRDFCDSSPFACVYAKHWYNQENHPVAVA